jgi:hypothetical protein
LFFFVVFKAFLIKAHPIKTKTIFLLGICLTRTLSALAESELRAQIPSLKMPTPERASASE